MRTFLLTVWDRLRSAFWFIPALLTVASVLAALGTIELDQRFITRGVWLRGLVYSGTVEGARTLLSTIAAFMVNIITLVFSITIVAMVLAAQQMGPRLLRNFVRDRVNQAVLGTFTATFVYNLLVLQMVQSQEQETFIPRLSVTVGVLLSLVSVGVLIYFIHHVAQSIQAPTVIARVSGELTEVITSLYPPRHERRRADEPDMTDEHRLLRRRVESDGRAVFSSKSGYVQAIDEQALLRLACEHDRVMLVTHRPGKFVHDHGDLVFLHPPHPPDEALIQGVRDAFYIGKHRTTAQDAEFAVLELVEVAVRALSPGINDPFTAINCVDHLGGALAFLCGRRMPSPLRADGRGSVRLILDVTDYRGLVDAAFDQIRQASHQHPAVLIRMLEVITTIVRRTCEPAQRDALLRQASMIHTLGVTAVNEPNDCKDVQERFDRLMNELTHGSNASGCKEE